MTKITNKFKIAIAAIAFMSYGAVNAQTAGGATTSLGKGAEAAADAQGGHVRVIDNKGTKKFLTSNNGITMFTDNAPDGGIVTTWQLGGTLTESTIIDTNGQTFAITGTADASADAAATAYDATGYTLVVRDEATGEMKKLLVTDLITSGQTYFTAANNQLTYDVSAVTATPTMAGAQIPLPEYSKVWVYRNGAKLIAGVDYTIAASTVTLDPTGSVGGAWAVYAGDIIEVQYYK